jgi:hypothetical protein
MVRRFLFFVGIFLSAVSLGAQTYAPPRYLVSEPLFNAVATEFSGEQAKENVRDIVAFHRIQASPGYSEARAWVVDRLKAMGMNDVEVESFPSDGKIRYQTYRSPLAWTVREGELWVEAPARQRLCRFTELPMCLTTLSSGGEWSGELAHVGGGTSAADYEGVDVKGKIVMASGYAGSVHREAVIKRGAVGVVIYPPADDRPEHPDLVRYNGLWPTGEEKDRVGFGFQISRRQAEWLAALGAQAPVRLRAKVEAEIHPGQLEVISALFPGGEQPEQEIILIAHLDHPKWSANDNASGSGALLEVARTLKTLIAAGEIRLRRSVRLLWVPEHFGTIAWVDKHRDISRHALAVLNLDMVGEDLHKTNSILRITRTPGSLPSFLNELVENVAAQVAAADLVAPTGSRHLFHYKMTPYDPGSDHDIFNDSTVGVPAIMFGHWPDWTHHTSEDTLDKVDPTTLRRVGVLATAAALWLATATDADAMLLATQLPPQGVRSVEILMGQDGKDWLAQLMTRFGIAKEVWPSLEEPPTVVPPEKQAVPRRLFLGPLADSYASTWFREQLGTDYAWWEEQKDKIPHWEILVYETLNFTTGKRSLAEIEEAVRAEFGAVPDGVVEHFLRDLEKVKLVEFSPPKTE